MDEDRDVRIELNCICGEVLCNATYIHQGKVIILVNPCSRCCRPEKKNKDESA